MASVYVFVDAVKEVPDKIIVLSHTIDSIFKQTIECILFIREYTGKGFGGKFRTVLVSILNLCHFEGRMLANLILDKAQAKVDEFIQKFTELRANFETGINVQVAMVTFRIQQAVTLLRSYFY